MRRKRRRRMRRSKRRRRRRRRRKLLWNIRINETALCKIRISTNKCNHNSIMTHILKNLSSMNSAL
jgi:cytidylate kinase